MRQLYTFLLAITTIAMAQAQLVTDGKEYVRYTDYSTSKNLPVSDPIVYMETDQEDVTWVVQQRFEPHAKGDIAQPPFVTKYRTGQRNAIYYSRNHFPEIRDDIRVNDFASDRKKGFFLATDKVGVMYYNGEKATYLNSMNSKLPEDNVLSIAWDSYGSLLWCATLSGIYVYDGHDWTRYNTSNSKLADNKVYNLLIDAEGTVWADTGKGICSFDGEQWTQHEVVLKGSDVRRMKTDAEGRIYAYYRYEEVTDEGKTTVYSDAQYRDGTTWTALPNELIGNEGIYDLYVDRANTLWIASATKGMIAVKDADGVPIDIYTAANSGLKDKTIRHITQDSFGKMMFALYDSPRGYEPEKLTRLITTYSSDKWDYLYSDGMMSNAIQRMWLTESNTIGLHLDSFEGGDDTFMIRDFNTKEMHLVPKEIEAAGKVYRAHALAPAAGDELWLTAWELNAEGEADTERAALIRLNATTGVQQVFTKENSDLAGEPYHIYIDLATGMEWVIYLNGGIASIEGEKWTTYTAENSGLPSNMVADVMVDSKGRVWFGTDKGIATLADGEWSVITDYYMRRQTVSAEAGRHCRAFAEDGEGTVWMLARDKVGHTTGETMYYDVVVAFKEKLSSRYYMDEFLLYEPGGSLYFGDGEIYPRKSILISTYGSIWVIGEGGYGYDENRKLIDYGRVVRLNDMDEWDVLYDRSALDIVEDGKEDVYISTGWEGILKFKAPARPVESVSLSAIEAQLMIGESVMLTAEVLPHSAENKQVTWKSSNDEVAKVATDGAVTAVAAGKAVITVTTDEGKKTATCEITVEDTPIFIVQEMAPVGEDNQGIIQVSLTKPRRIMKTGYIRFKLPAGIGYDFERSRLSEELSDVATIDYPIGDDDGYWRVYIFCTDDNCDELIEVKDIMQVAYTVDEEVKRGTYTAEFKNIDLTLENGWIRVSDIEASITVDRFGVGAEEVGRAVVRLYPNPVGSMLTIEATEGIREVTVVSASGQIVYTRKGRQAESVTLDAAGWLAGVYFVHLKTLAGEETHRIIKE